MNMLKNAVSGICRSSLAFMYLALLAAQASAQQPAPTRIADPAAWGIYATLVGTTWGGTEGGVGGAAQWQWASDDTIVEKRQYYKDQIISRGANPGELVAVYGSGLGMATYDGRIAADGSVLWIRRGLVKTPMRAAIVDGRYREELVKLDDAGQIVKIKSTGWYSQNGAPAPKSAEAAQSTAIPAVATASSASTQPISPDASVAASMPLSKIRGFEPFLGKTLYADVDHTLLVLARAADGSFQLNVTQLDGSPAWGFTVAESATKPGQWEMVRNAYADKYARTAQWISDHQLSLSSRSAMIGGSTHKHDFIVDGGTIKSVSSGMMKDYVNTVVYVETSAAAVAQIRSDRERAAALAAQERARLAAIAAQQQAEAQRLQKEAEAREAALWLQRWNKLHEIAATDPYAAQAFANQYGLPYTNPLEASQEQEWEDEEPAKPAAWFQALQDMNAAASASEARSRASLDATLQQAAQQAAYERQLAAQREQAAANARYAEEARRAREATERQHEIARQFEAQQQAQRQARAQAEREAALRVQQVANTPATSAGTTRSSPVAGATVNSPPDYAAERCQMVHPKVNDTYNTVKGEEFGRKYLRDRAEASCLSKTGNSGIDGDATCTADGPYVWKCKILVQCAGTMRSPMCASNAQ